MSNLSTVDESYYLASQWQLMWRKFRKHRLAVGGGTVLALCYLVALFCVSLAPYDVGRRFPEHIYAPPVRVHFVDAEGRLHLRPFVYGLVKDIHPETWVSIYTEDTSVRFPLRFFVRGDPYKLWGVLRTDVRLFGVAEPGVLFLFGTDDLGRDLFSRVLYATRISLSISLVGVLLSFVIGCVLGGISGYYGGSVDMAVQRVIEFILSLPTIPLWLALAAALPAQWKPLQVYFGISIVLSAVGWTRLARVIRGKFLELREEDFVLAGRVAGATDRRIIAAHLIPSFLSFLIVSLTLAVPNMILAETALSFLGVGLRSPVVSWGVLMQEAQNVQTIALYPWLMIPGVFVVVTVLAFNFLGDGLRDAADPYK